MTRSLLRYLVFFVALQFWLLPKSVLAQALPTDDWEVGIIHVREENHGKQIPSTYWPIEIKELRSRLDTIRDQRLMRRLRPTVLEEAVYVASLQREWLISDQSRWTVGGHQGSAPALVGQVSFMLKNARNLAEDQLQLSADQQFSLDGKIELIPDAEKTVRWFGFQCVPTGTGTRRQFQIEVPPCLLGSMLILADSSLDISSQQAVVERVESPQPHLPLDWPEVILPAVTSGFGQPSSRSLPTQESRSQWWLVHLSGISQFSLEVEQAIEAGSSAIRHALRSTNVEYLLGENQVTLKAGFQFADFRHSQPIQFRLDPKLRLQSLSFDDQAVPWEAVTDNLESYNVIQVGSRFVKPTSRIELIASTAFDHLELENDEEADSTSDTSTIDASAVLPSHTDSLVGELPARMNAGESIILLPSVQLIAAHTIEGRTLIVGQDRRRVSRVISNHRFTPGRFTSDSVERDGPEAFAWRGRWIGQSSDILVHTAIDPQEWNSSGITNLVVRDSSISATSRIRVAGRHLSSNFLKVPLSPEWVVDRVQLAQSVSVDARLQLVNGPEEDRHILIHWQQALSGIELDLDILAHLPAKPIAGQLVIENARILQLPDGTHHMNFSVEDGAEYELLFSPRMLQMTATEGELPLWQRSLLPSSNSLVFSDFSDSRNLFAFEASTGTYTAQTLTVVQNELGKAWRSVSRIACQPQSGTVDRVRVSFADETELPLWRFEYIQQDESSVLLHPSNFHIDANSDDIEFDLELPTANSDAFELRAIVDVLSPVDEHPLRLEVTTLGLPTALRAEAMLLLPDRFDVESGESPIELLPRGACCERVADGTFADLLKGSFFSSYLGARIDGSDSQQMTIIQSRSPSLELESNPESNVQCWIWREFVQHRIDDSGLTTHDVSLVVQANHDQVLDIDLPSHWRFEGLARDPGTREEPGSGQHRWQPGVLQVPISAGQKVSLDIQFSSQRSPLGWLARISLERPSYRVPVMQRQESMVASPKSLAVQSGESSIAVGGQPIPATPRTEPISHRWHALGWWQWLHPARFDQPRTEKTHLWSTYTLDRSPRSEQRQLMIWLLDRNAISAILVAAVSLGSAFSWLVLRRSLRAWWILALVAIGLNLVAPDSLDVLGQLLLLAVALGSVWRMVERIASRPASNDLRSIRGHSSLSTTTAVLVLACCGSVQAQPTDTKPLDESAGVKTFGVFIPSDDENLPVGEYAYIPKQLRDLLYENQTIPVGPAENMLSGARILSANYFVRLKQNVREADPIQECTAELRLLVTEANSEILLPISGKGLSWIGTPLLNGQSRIWDGRNFRLSPEGSGLLFRSDSTGVMQLNLQFKPMVDELSDRRLEFQVAIPPVPNATVQVFANRQISNLSVDARGLVQRTLLGDTLVNLGPVDQLKVAWSTSERTAIANSAEQISETWISTQAQNVQVACQLTLERGQSLRGELDLSIHADWQPIGSVWGDAEWISTASSSLFPRRNIYRIRLNEVSGTDYRIRLMLVPRDLSSLETLEIPFLSLDRVTSKATLLWWTAERDAEWVLDIADSRPVRADIVSDWGPFALSTERVGYQIFGSGVQLRRQGIASANQPVLEANSLRIRSNRSVLEYEANWEPTANQPDELLVEIPISISQPILEVNGVPARYQLADNNRIMLISMKDNGIGRLGRLRLSLELPVLSGLVRSIPRVTLVHETPRQSIYRIFRGADIEVELLESPNDFAFDLHTGSGMGLGAETGEPAGLARNTTVAILDRLELKVGETTLPARLMKSTQIPMKLEIRMAPVRQPDSFVMFLDHTSQGWVGTVRCEWLGSSEESSVAFFDLPFSLRDSLDSGLLPFKFMPHIDPNRTNLCVPVPEADQEGRQRIEFSLRLSLGQTSQSIAIPTIRAHSSTMRPVVALPATLDAEPIRWVNAGRVLGSSWHEQSGIPESEGYTFHTLPDHQFQVAWLPQEESRKPARLALLAAVLKSSSDQTVAGIVHYWIDPKGQLLQQFEIPDACEILGIECNGQPAHWSRSGHTVRVLLQPNFLPVQVSLMVSWSLPENSLIRVPLAVGQNQGNQVLVKISNDSQWLVSGARSVEPNVFSTILANQWADLVSAVAPQLGSLPELESKIWLGQWRPELFGFSRDQVIYAKSSGASLESLDLNDDGELTVGELWSAAELFAEFGTQEDPRPAPRMELEVDSRYWIVSGNEIALKPTAEQTKPANSHSYSRTLLLLLLGLLVISPWLVDKGLALFSRFPWLDWILLALLIWVVMPTFWPSLVIAAVGGWLAVSRHLDQRRRMRGVAA